MIKPINQEKSDITVNAGKNPNIETMTPAIVPMYAETLIRGIFCYLSFKSKYNLSISM